MVNKHLSNKQENEKIKHKIVELFEIVNAHRATENVYNKKRKSLQTDISNYLFANGIDGCEFKAITGTFASEPTILTVKRIKRTKVTYLPEKLEKALGKVKSKKVIEKKYIINDFTGLVDYLKECGVDPKVFKTFIDVEKTVDAKGLQKMYDLGEVSLADIKGCYDISTLSSYIDVKIKND